MVGCEYARGFPHRVVLVPYVCISLPRVEFLLSRVPRKQTDAWPQGGESDCGCHVCKCRGAHSRRALRRLGLVRAASPGFVLCAVYFAASWLRLRLAIGCVDVSQSECMDAWTLSRCQRLQPCTADIHTHGSRAHTVGRRHRSTCIIALLPGGGVLVTGLIVTRRAHHQNRWA